MKFVLYLLHNSKGALCVWVKAVRNDFLAQNCDAKQQYLRDIAVSAYGYEQANMFATLKY